MRPVMRRLGQQLDVRCAHRRTHDSPHRANYGKMNVMDDLITAQEAAALLHMHVKRVQQLARDGKLPAVRYGRKWLFRRRELI